MTYRIIFLLPLSWLSCTAWMSSVGPGAQSQLGQKSSLFSTTTPSTTNRRRFFTNRMSVASAVTDASGATAVSPEEGSKLTSDAISKLRYRQLQVALKQRSLDSTGTTAQLRKRLKEVEGLLPDECVVNEDQMSDDCADDVDLGKLRIDFVDQADPDFERKELLRTLDEKVQLGHWKAAVRKLKQYSRRYENVPESTLSSVLNVCMEGRLQGARASEPVRKILELMVELQYPISEKVGNYCIKNCLGFESPFSTHQGFGGIDTALAMLSALEQAQTPIQLETYDKLLSALAREGSIPAAVAMLRTVVNDKSETPALATFADVAHAAATTKLSNEESSDPAQTTYADQIPAILGLAKASGYDLDTIAAIEDGRNLLASGIIASEQLENVGLGLRLLTAASKASIVDPNNEGQTGDLMVASSSPMAQRASTLIHKRAINRAVQDQQWKLAVRLLELMLERNLKPSPWIWRNVVTCCAKAEKSRKASSVLLDWVAASERGDAEKPPLSVFNTVMNACEICNEQDLTLEVLDSMKKTHNTEGNIITFNIALKRLAKQSNSAACEGIIVSMLTEGVEPTVVSYTTAIASCVSKEEAKRPALAYEWLKRMRSRNVNPNVLTYNTALASCEDGTLESAVLAGKIASEMLVDVEKQLASNAELAATRNKGDTDKFDKGADAANKLTNVIPDSSTRALARRLLKQVDEAVVRGEMDARVAEETVKKSLNALAEYVDCTTDECFLEQIASGKQPEEINSGDEEPPRPMVNEGEMEEDEMDVTSRDEFELEYTVVSEVHRIAEV